MGGKDWPPVFAGDKGHAASHRLNNVGLASSNGGEANGLEETMPMGPSCVVDHQAPFTHHSIPMLECAVVGRVVHTEPPGQDYCGGRKTRDVQGLSIGA